MVEVHVAQLLKASVGTQRLVELDESEPDLGGDVAVAGPLRGRAQLTRTPDGVLVDCTYEARVDRECGRCLDISNDAVTGRLSQEFVTTTNVITGLPEPIVGDPDIPRIGPDHLLDLGEAIRQDMVIHQPLRPLCRAECAGLCAECGQNLNDARCHCGSAEGEGLSRLGELLKEKLSRER